MSVRVLVLGSGELGTHLLNALTEPRYKDVFSVGLLCREKTINSEDPAVKSKLDGFKKRGVQLYPGDANSDLKTLTASIAAARPQTFIVAVGYNIDHATPAKLFDAAQAAGVKRFLPWEFGFDYQNVGYGSAQSVFDDKLKLREYIHDNNKGTDVLLISTGIFTDFVFAREFGAITGLDTDNPVVTAPGSLDNQLTCTSLKDIGALTARLLEANESGHVKIGGDEVSYGQLADIIEAVTGKSVKRVVVPLDELREQSKTLTGDAQLNANYALAMAAQKGIHWPTSETWNHKHNIPAQSARDWAAEHLAKQQWTARSHWCVLAVI